MVNFNPRLLVGKILEERLIIIPIDPSNEDANSRSKQKENYPILSLDSLSVHGILTSEDGNLFAFFSKEKYWKIIVEYKNKFYDIIERKGDVYYLRSLKNIPK